MFGREMCLTHVHSIEPLLTLSDLTPVPGIAPCGLGGPEKSVLLLDE